MRRDTQRVLVLVNIGKGVREGIERNNTVQLGIVTKNC